MNLYGYVGGMPLMLVDPMGLFVWEAIKGGGRGLEEFLRGSVGAESGADPCDTTLSISYRLGQGVGAAWSLVGAGKVVKALAKAVVKKAGAKAAAKGVRAAAKSLKDLKPMSGFERHHWIPQEFRAPMKKLGIEIDNYVTRVPTLYHRNVIHGGKSVYGPGGRYNAEWREFLSPGRSVEEIMDFMDRQIAKYWF
jgi:hypothetical protein